MRLTPFARDALASRIIASQAGTCDQVRIQDVVNDSAPVYCCYGGDYPNGCWYWTPDEWLTIQMHIKIGTWNVAGTSRVRVWAAREDQPSVIVYDSDVGGQSHSFAGKLFNNDPANVKYGKLWLLPYNTGKDSAETHPPAYVWYDDLIISTAKIAEPDGSGGATESPPIPSNLIVD